MHDSLMGASSLNTNEATPPGPEHQRIEQSNGTSQAAHPVHQAQARRAGTPTVSCAWQSPLVQGNEPQHSITMTSITSVRPTGALSRVTAAGGYTTRRVEFSTPDGPITSAPGNNDGGAGELAWDPTARAEKRGLRHAEKTDGMDTTCMPLTSINLFLSAARRAP